MEDVQDVQSVQAAFNIAMTKKALNFEADMAANLITGSLQKGAEMQAMMSRDAGLAAQGIGTKVNVTV